MVLYLLAVSFVTVCLSLPKSLQSYPGSMKSQGLATVLLIVPAQVSAKLLLGKEMGIAMMETTMLDVIGTVETAAITTTQIGMTFARIASA